MPLDPLKIQKSPNIRTVTSIRKSVIARTFSSSCFTATITIMVATTIVVATATGSDRPV